MGPFWIAPEVLRGERYGFNADVWSLGCVICEMASAQHPWPQFNNPFAAMLAIAESTDTPHIPEHLSPTARSFVKRCLERDMNKRASVSELLTHPFVCVDGKAPGFTAPLEAPEDMICAQLGSLAA